MLFAAHEQGLSLNELFDRLPKRFSRAALLKNFPRPLALAIVEQFSTADKSELGRYFPPELSFGAISHLDLTDGLRIVFTNGDVAHLRPSGNADEFRIYSVAGTQARADEIVKMGVAEPNGILRRMEKAVRPLR